MKSFITVILLIACVFGESLEDAGGFDASVEDVEAADASVEAADASVEAVGDVGALPGKASGEASGEASDETTGAAVIAGTGVSDTCKDKDDSGGEYGRLYCRDNNRYCSVPTYKLWMSRNCAFTCCTSECKEYPERCTWTSGASSADLDEARVELFKVKNDLINLQQDSADKAEEFRVALAAKGGGGEGGGGVATKVTGKPWWSALDVSGNRGARCSPQCTHLKDFDTKCGDFNTDQCSRAGRSTFDMSVWNAYYKWRNEDSKTAICKADCLKEYTDCEKKCLVDDCYAEKIDCDVQRRECLTEATCKTEEDTNTECAGWALAGHCNSNTNNALVLCPRTCQKNLDKPAVDLTPKFCSACSDPMGYLCKATVKEMCVAKTFKSTSILCTEDSFKITGANAFIWIKSYYAEYTEKCSVDFCAMTKQGKIVGQYSNRDVALKNNCATGDACDCDDLDDPTCVQARDDYVKEQCAISTVDSGPAVGYAFNYYRMVAKYIEKTLLNTEYTDAFSVDHLCPQTCCNIVNEEEDSSSPLCCAEGYKFCEESESCVLLGSDCSVCEAGEIYCRWSSQCISEELSKRGGCSGFAIHNFLNGPELVKDLSKASGKGGQCDGGKLYCVSNDECQTSTAKCSKSDDVIVGETTFTQVGAGLCADDKKKTFSDNAVSEGLDADSFNIKKCAKICEKAKYNCLGFSYNGFEAICRLYGDGLKVEQITKDEEKFKRGGQYGRSGSKIGATKISKSMNGYTAQDGKYNEEASAAQCYKKPDVPETKVDFSFELRAGGKCISLGKKPELKTCDSGDKSMKFTFAQGKGNLEANGKCLHNDGKVGKCTDRKADGVSIAPVTGDDEKKLQTIKLDNGKCLGGRKRLKAAACHDSKEKQSDQIYLVSVIKSTILKLGQ